MPAQAHILLLVQEVVHEGLLLLQYGLLLGCSMLGSLGHAGHFLLQNAVACPYERDLFLGTPGTSLTSWQ